MFAYLKQTVPNNYTYNSNVKVDNSVIYTKLYKNVIMKNGRKPAWSLCSLYENAGTRSVFPSQITRVNSLAFAALH